MVEDDFKMEIGGSIVGFIKYCDRWSYCGWYGPNMSTKLLKICQVLDTMPEGYAGLNYPELLKAMEII